MITINIDPVIVHFGHFALRWYGVIVTASIALGVHIASREAMRKGLRPADFQEAVLWVLGAGLVGARLFHVIDHWPHEYASDPLRSLYIWEGGLAIWGGVVGGLLALAAFAWQRKLSLGRLADAGAPGLVLAQAVGRLACVITGDAMGPPTDGPIGFAYVNPGAMVPQRGVFYTPMPVYKLVVNLVIFALLWRLRRRRWPDGGLFPVYLILYSLERFFLAFVSSYQIMAFGLTQSQLVALVTLAIAGPLGVRMLLRSGVLAAT
ncbi:MAG: prolipoprotein diacylglyceryl transferase [Chloroflexota bacterium]